MAGLTDGEVVAGWHTTVRPNPFLRILNRFSVIRAGGMIDIVRRRGGRDIAEVEIPAGACIPGGGVTSKARRVGPAVMVERRYVVANGEDIWTAYYVAEIENQ